VCTWQRDTRVCGMSDVVGCDRYAHGDDTRRAAVRVVQAHRGNHGRRQVRHLRCFVVSSSPGLRPLLKLAPPQLSPPLTLIVTIPPVALLLPTASPLRRHPRHCRPRGCCSSWRPRC
jgi:hypothetical protein